VNVPGISKEKPIGLLVIGGLYRPSALEVTSVGRWVVF